MIGNIRIVIYRSTRRFALIFAFIVLLLAALLLAGCRNPLSRRKPSARQDQQVVTSTLTCPIDGLPISTDRMLQRPLAVMVENSPAARPQSGLNDACVVYEAVTEGGITRFLAIYHHAAPEVIGPVRSARPHFIHFAREYDAAYAHCGESYEALEMLASTPQIFNLDQMKFGKAFWRDHSRRAPHNLYTSAARLQKVVEKQRWGGSPSVMPSFTSDRLLTDGAPADTVELRFNGAVKYTLRFTYDAKRGGYLRYMDGKLHVDRETGEPVVAKNVLIQRVQTTVFPESTHQTMDVSVIGSGAGIFISNRRQIPLQWQKHWSAGLTDHTDEHGAKLPFQPGQTWVEILSTEGTISISGPPAAG